MERLQRYHDYVWLSPGPGLTLLGLTVAVFFLRRKPSK